MLRITMCSTGQRRCRAASCERCRWQSKMRAKEPKYSSGEIILRGDRIRYNGENGEVDFIITEESPDWDSYWHDLGEGVMLKVPSFGSVYVPFLDGELEFISRFSEKIAEDGK
jgi:signal peptidase I